MLSQPMAHSKGSCTSHTAAPARPGYYCRLSVCGCGCSRLVLSPHSYASLAAGGGPVTELSEPLPSQQGRQHAHLVVSA